MSDVTRRSFLQHATAVGQHNGILLEQRVGTFNGQDIQWSIPLPASLPNPPVFLQDWHLDANGTRFQNNEEKND